jgi:hypothetical protein
LIHGFSQGVTEGENIFIRLSQGPLSYLEIVLDCAVIAALGLFREIAGRELSGLPVIGDALAAYSLPVARIRAVARLLVRFYRAGSHILPRSCYNMLDASSASLERSPFSRVTWA